MSAPVTIEDHERVKAVVLSAWTALAPVVMAPGSPDTRFRREMSGRTDLTSRQFDYLRRLVRRYHRQIGERASTDIGEALSAVAVSYDEP